METINNPEPMPHTPQGANGQWQWDGHTTARHRNVDGSEWLLKGAWRWVQEQKKVQAEKTIAMQKEKLAAAAKDAEANDAGDATPAE